MPYRKTPLVRGKIYHVYNKSIAGYRIFNDIKNYKRFLYAILFYSIENQPDKFSHFIERNGISAVIDFCKNNFSNRRIRLIAYCIMPTHYHLLVEQLKDGGISRFISSLQKSYSEFFNKQYKRKGPLWEGRFQNALVDKDEYFLHLTRYIHLNPVTLSLIDKPEDWDFSSYKEYLGLIPENEKICSFTDYFNMDGLSYKEFVNDRIGYQRELAKIKHLIFE